MALSTLPAPIQKVLLDKKINKDQTIIYKTGKEMLSISEVPFNFIELFKLLSLFLIVLVFGAATPFSL